MKSKLSALILLGILLSSTTHTPAQEGLLVKNPPIVMETMVGDRGLFYQIMIDKKFQSIPRLGFFSVSSVVGEWNTRKVDDLMIQAHLTYQVYKGLTINGGFHHTPMTGIRPTAGLMYSYANPKWTVVIFPRTDLTAKANVELFGLAEYKPKITDKLNFYSRVQGMYVQNPSMDAHQKSGLVLRAGVSYREFTVGAAFNADYYGPDKTNINNTGGFISVALF